MTSLVGKLYWNLPHPAITFQIKISIENNNCINQFLVCHFRQTYVTLDLLETQKLDLNLQVHINEI